MLIKSNFFLVLSVSLHLLPLLSALSIQNGCKVNGFLMNDKGKSENLFTVLPAQAIRLE